MRPVECSFILVFLQPKSGIQAYQSAGNNLRNLSREKIHQSISTGAQYVTLDDKIKCLSLAIFISATPTNKTVTGTAYTWELLIGGPIIMIDQSEILSHNQVQFITLFFGGAELCCAFYQPRASCTNLVQKNQFPELFDNKFYSLESHSDDRWRCFECNQ